MIVAVTELVSVVCAFPFESVLTLLAPRVPAVVVNVTGMEVSRFPLVSATEAVIVDTPPCAEMVVGFADTTILPTAAAPMAIFTEPVAGLTTHHQGSAGSLEVQGNIGTTVLERFRCTFDYARGTLWLALSPGGVVEFHPRTRRMVIHGPATGLASDEVKSYHEEFVTS